MGLSLFLLLLGLSALVVTLWKTVSFSWTHPIRLFSVEWMFFVIVPIVVNMFEYEFNGIGLAWILLAVISYELGGALGNSMWRKMRPSVHRELCRPVEFYKLGWWFVNLNVLLASLAFVSTVLTQGFNISSFFNLNDFISMNTEMAYRRYNGAQSGNGLIQILSVFYYAAPLCGGYAICFATKKKEKILCVISLLPITLLMLFSNAKAGFIAACILWTSGYIISYYVKFGRTLKLKIKTVARILISLGVFFVLLYLVMLIRVGDFSKEMRDFIAQKFFVYGFGQMVSFDAWFAQKDFQQVAGVGKNTYMAVFDLLGVTERQQGVYEVLVNGYGNVFTAFRAVISDFGKYIGLFYMFVRGVITALAYNMVVGQRSKPHVVSKCLLAASYFWGIHSVFGSPWVYTLYVLSVMTFGAFLILAHYRIVWREGD